MKYNSQLFFLMCVFFFLSECSVAAQNNAFVYTLDQVEAALLSKDLTYKRKILKKLATDNIELRPREALRLIQMGLKDLDPYVREYSIAALQKLAYFHRINKDTYSSDQFPLVYEFINKKEFKNIIELMVNDKSRKIRVTALSTIEFGYGPAEDVKNIILEEIEKESDPNFKRDMVLLLGFGKYAIDKKVQSQLINIVHNEKTEAAEVAAMVLASVNPPVLDAMPAIMNLLESEERFADDDLLQAIASYGHWAEPYLARLSGLEKGIDDRVNNPTTSANFKRHAVFLKNSVNKSVNFISIKSDFYHKNKSHIDIIDSASRISVFLKSNRRLDFLFFNVNTSSISLILIFSFIIFSLVSFYFLYKKYKARR